MPAGILLGQMYKKFSRFPNASGILNTLLPEDFAYFCNRTQNVIQSISNSSKTTILCLHNHTFTN